MDNNNSNNYYLDLYRLVGNKKRKSYILALIKHKSFRQIVYYRKYNSCKNRLKKTIYRLLYGRLSRKGSIEIPLSAKIGDGLLLIHPYNITINSRAIIGNNCTILKGVTVGATKNKNGENLVPIIGDNVYLGVNSTIVGGIKVGNNSLIAANSFVNKDVPNDSIVIGNPSTIHAKKNASDLYINNSIEKLK